MNDLKAIIYTWNGCFARYFAGKEEKSSLYELKKNFGKAEQQQFNTGVGNEKEYFTKKYDQQ